MLYDVADTNKSIMINDGITWKLWKAATPIVDMDSWINAMVGGRSKALSIAL